jgi:SAM-dependent methyltransferase
MSTSVYHRDTCRLCGTTLDLALSLAPTPLGDDWVPAEKVAEPQELYPMDLGLCPECGNTQLLDVVLPEVIYEDYVYMTSVSLGLSEHFQRYAADVMAGIAPAPGGLVVEIGSNEGALLKAFQAHGMRVLGVDPAKEIARFASESGVETLAAYFDRPLAQRLRAERGAAAIVSANNVFANLDDVDSVTEGIRELLAPDGVFVFETSYFLDVMQKALLDTIFHEHLTYFSAAPMRRFFAKHGMELIDVTRVPTKGGSLRGVAQLAGGPRPVSAAVGELIAEEEAAGIHRKDSFPALLARLEKTKGELHDLLDPLVGEGKSVAAYGAAVGLTTMIYQFELGDLLEFIADDSDTVQGLFSPGLHIPVLPSGSLLERRPDYTVILAWRYTEPIVARNQAYLEAGGRFVSVMPKVGVM